MIFLLDDELQVTSALENDFSYHEAHKKRRQIAHLLVSTVPTLAKPGVNNVLGYTSNFVERIEIIEEVSSQQGEDENFTTGDGDFTKANLPHFDNLENLNPLKTI